MRTDPQDEVYFLNIFNPDLKALSISYAGQRAADTETGVVAASEPRYERREPQPALMPTMARKLVGNLCLTSSTWALVSRGSPTMLKLGLVR